MKNKYAYVIYESNSHDLQCDGCNITDLIIVTDNKKKAIETFENEVNNAIATDYILDENDIDDYKKFLENEFVNFSTTLFYNYQENWSCYYEIHFERKEIE